MTTTPDEPQVPSGDPADATPPPQAPTTPAGPPPAYGAAPPPPAYGAAPPPAYGAAPPPAYGAAPPPAYGAGGYPQQPAYGTAAGAPLSDSDQRLWATLSHVGGILFGFLAPLVIWLVFKERGRFVEEQSKEALNFQITLTIAYIVSSILMIVVIGFITFAIAWICAIVFGIMGAMATNKGQAYRYPFALRLIK